MFDFSYETFKNESLYVLHETMKNKSLYVLYQTTKIQSLYAMIFKGGVCKTI